MTTTPAMPELPEGVTLEDLLIPLRAALDTCHDTDWTLRQFKTHITHALVAIATLQAQPAEVAVSDEDIWRLWDSQDSPELSGGPCPVKFASAILALRPQAVPMTEGWQEVAACPDGDVWFSLSCGHVVMGWKQGPLLLDWEAAVDHDCCSDASAIKAMPVTPPAHHGITAPAGGEVK